MCQCVYSLLRDEVESHVLPGFTVVASIADRDVHRALNVGLIVVDSRLFNLEQSVEQHLIRWDYYEL